MLSQYGPLDLSQTLRFVVASLGSATTIPLSAQICLARSMVTPPMVLWYRKEWPSISTLVSYLRKYVTSQLFT